MPSNFRVNDSVKVTGSLTETHVFSKRTRYLQSSSSASRPLRMAWSSSPSFVLVRFAFLGLFTARAAGADGLHDLAAVLGHADR